MKWENDTFGLVLRRAMVYSSKDFNLVDFCRDSAKYASIMAFAAPKVESLWFLYQAEGLPKNISIEEFFDERSGKPITAQSTESTILLSTNGTGRRIRRFILLQ